ncbi:outer membrane protein assembly factor BamC [SAR86 cluster bacterium]|jgi:outer membrane protein assembly factor BamC|nr:outer membrane protein assembly factor BamC [SAR86 cluster bacterium]
MKTYFINIPILFLFFGCSSMSGPDGFFPDTKYDFFDEQVADEIILPDHLNQPNKENHFPVTNNVIIEEDIDVPKPRQIFASSGTSAVQLRRLGELMWVYIETLPSTSWPIAKNYWDTSIYSVISANPENGKIKVDFDDESILEMRIEHGIKEASTEIFLYVVNKNNNEILSNPEFIRSELEKMVNYLAQSVNNFSGTSLAAQNLNENKKAKIFSENGQTVISLELSFDRAWSSVSKALDAANIIANDKNRSAGIFYVSYQQEERNGFFSFLGFGKERNSSTLSNESDFEVTITEKNNKSYVRARPTNDNIQEAEELLSKINEALS